MVAQAGEVRKSPPPVLPGGGSHNRPGRGGPSWAALDPQLPRPPPPPPPFTPSATPQGGWGPSDPQGEGPPGIPYRRNWASVVGAPASGTSPPSGAPPTGGGPQAPPATTAAGPEEMRRPVSAAARGTSGAPVRESLQHRAPSEGRDPRGPLTAETGGASSSNVAAKTAAEGPHPLYVHKGGPGGGAEVQRPTPQWGPSSSRAFTGEGRPQHDGRSIDSQAVGTPKVGSGGPPRGPRSHLMGIPTSGQEVWGPGALREGLACAEQAQHQGQQQPLQGGRPQASALRATGPKGHGWAGDSTGIWTYTGALPLREHHGGDAREARHAPVWVRQGSPNREDPLATPAHRQQQQQSSGVATNLCGLRAEDIKRLSPAEQAKALQAAQQQLAALQDAPKWQMATSKRERKRGPASGRHAETQLAHLLTLQQLLQQVQPSSPQGGPTSASRHQEGPPGNGLRSPSEAQQGQRRCGSADARDAAAKAATSPRKTPCGSPKRGGSR